MTAIAVGAWLLAGVLRTVAAGEPFDRRNPARLVGIALTVLTGGLLAPLAGAWARQLVVDRLDADGVLSAPVEVTFVPVLLAALLAVCAGAVRRGARSTAATPAVQPTAP